MPNLKFLASFIPEILVGSKNSKSGSRDPHMTPFDLILHFFRYYSLSSISKPTLKFLASFIPEILVVSQNSKSGSRDRHMTPFVLILHFFR